MSIPPSLSPQQRRENPDPQEGGRPVPWSLRILVILAVVSGLYYISQSDVETPAVWGDGRQAAELGPAKNGGTAKVDGAALFASRCAACHQAAGQGLPGVFPPLSGSEWANGNETTTVSILLMGISGDLTVKGQLYKGVMPAFGSQLSDEEIAAVLSHVRSQWGNTSAAISPATVARRRAELKDRTTPFAGDKDLSPQH